MRKFYLRYLDGTVFIVHSMAGRNLFVKMGCRQLNYEQFKKYPRFKN